MQISHYLSAYDMLHVLAPYVIEVLTALTEKIAKAAEMNSFLRKLDTHSNFLV